MKNPPNSDRLGRAFVGDVQIGTIEHTRKGWTGLDLKGAVVIRDVRREVALEHLDRAHTRLTSASAQQLGLPGVNGGE